MKKCSTCKNELPRDSFTRNKRIKGGLHYSCRDCVEDQRQGRKRRINNRCPGCDELILPNSSMCKECKAFNTRGEGSPHWKGGRYRREDGYVSVWVDKDDSFHPGGSRHIMEHRLVMSQTLGRPLLSEEDVHHKNGVRDDNRPENLELWSKSQPPGQRVEDKVEWAIELLGLYRPEVLQDHLTK